MNLLPGDKLKPAPLKPGDLVAVVAPAGPVDETALASGLKVLENLGFRVRLGESLTARRGYLAGPDEARVADLNAALSDPDVRGIVSARGGYGSGRILNLVDYAAFKNDPKVFVGYSDVTALHLAFARETGVVTFHGPMVESLGERLTRFTLECFQRAVTSADPLDVLPLPADYPLPRVLGAGRATGVLAGGNLSLVTSLAGTDYEIEARGRILVVEDVDEKPYRVDRMLCQLALGGKLGQAVGVAVGEMVNCEYVPEVDPVPAAPSAPPAPAATPASGALSASPASAAPGTAPASALPARSLTLSEVLADHLSTIGRPVVSGFPCGHGRDKWTLPLGVVATLDGYKARLIIEEAACEVS